MSRTPRYVNTNNLAELFSVSRATVSRWNSLGLIPKPRKVGRQRVYDLRDVCEAVEKNCLNVPADVVELVMATL